MLNGNESSPPGSNSATSDGLPVLSDPCRAQDLQGLIVALNRQAAVMERLVNLLPQWIAVNQALLEALTEPDDGTDDATQYLDGGLGRA